MEEISYVVLFTLDVSGSMSGTRWKSVCESVENIVDHLSANDLVAGLTFNDKVEILRPNREELERRRQ